MGSTELPAEVITNDSFRPFDVLLGRGRKFDGHEGNQHYRQLIKMSFRQYYSQSLTGKDVIARSIFHLIELKGGRFLIPMRDNCHWQRCSRGSCLARVKQALRDSVRKERKTAKPCSDIRSCQLRLTSTDKEKHRRSVGSRNGSNIEHSPCGFGTCSASSSTAVRSKPSDAEMTVLLGSFNETGPRLTVPFHMEQGSQFLRPPELGPLERLGSQYHALACTDISPLISHSAIRPKQDCLTEQTSEDSRNITLLQGRHLVNTSWADPLACRSENEEPDLFPELTLSPLSGNSVFSMPSAVINFQAIDLDILPLEVESAGMDLSVRQPIECTSAGDSTCSEDLFDHFDAS